MREITLEELLEAGCHFGHQVTRQNPKAREYIFEARDGIHIIDLAKTKEGLEAAGVYVRDLAASGGSLLIVGTKRQAKPIIDEASKKAKGQNSSDNLFYATNRWVGGTLTNYEEVFKNCKKLKDLREKLESQEEKAKYTKREIGLWGKERQKLEDLYGGIETMGKVPDALFIVDTHLEELAVKEAQRMEIKTVGITDTNSDPTGIDYPIPANDDAVGSIKLIVDYIIDAWIEGKNEGIKEEENKSPEEVKAIKEKKPRKKKETK